jgi:hypothetical protein
MPRAIKINEAELSQLRKHLNSHYHLDVVDYSSSETLHFLLKEKGLILSTSTIRRIFNVVESKGTASKYSLDSLAQFLTYENWAEFKQAFVNLNEQGFYNYLLEYNNFNYLPEEFFQFIVKNISFKYWEDIYKVKEFIHLVVIKKDGELLTRFFNTVEFNLERDNCRKWGLALNSFYKESKEGNQWIKEWVKSNLLHNLKLQTAIIEFYEGEDDLTGFYGEWLEACEHWEKEEYQLSSILLLTQKQLLLGDIEKANAIFSKADELKYNLHSKPVNIKNMAKYYALKSIFSSGSAFGVLVLDDIKDEIDKINFINTYCRLIWQFKDLVCTIDFCHPGNLRLNHLPLLVDRVTANRIMCNTWLVLAINYFNKGESEMTKRYLQLIKEIDNITWDYHWLQLRYNTLLKQMSL